MPTSQTPVTISSTDHARLCRIASAGMRIRRAPPSARLLAAELERAQVVKPANLPPSVIAMHSTFEFRDGITDQIRNTTLVYPGEEDADVGRTPVLSPLGAALIGLAEGQSHRWQSATGEWCTLQVVRVLHQTERMRQEVPGQLSTLSRTTPARPGSRTT